MLAGHPIAPRDSKDGSLDDMGDVRGWATRAESALGMLAAYAIRDSPA